MSVTAPSATYSQTSSASAGPKVDNNKLVDCFYDELVAIKNADDANKAFRTFKQLSSKDGQIPHYLLEYASNLFSHSCLENRYQRTLSQMSLTIYLISFGVLKTAPLDKVEKFDTLKDLAIDLAKRDGVFASLDQAVRERSEDIMKLCADAVVHSDIANLTEDVLLYRISKVMALPRAERGPHMDTLRAYKSLSIACREKSDQANANYSIALLHAQTCFTMLTIDRVDLRTKDVEDAHRMVMETIKPVLQKEPDKDLHQVIEARCQLQQIEDRNRYLPKHSNAHPRSKHLNAQVTRLSDDLTGAIKAFQTCKGLIDKPADPPKLRFWAAETSLLTYSDMLQESFLAIEVKTSVEKLLVENESIVHECCVVATKSSKNAGLFLRAAEFEVLRPTPDWKQAKAYLHQYAALTINDKVTNDRLRRYNAILLIVQTRDSIPEIAKSTESDTKQENETQQTNNPDYSLDDFLKALNYLHAKINLSIANEEFKIYCTLLKKLTNDKELMKNASPKQTLDYNLHTNSLLVVALSRLSHREEDPHALEEMQTELDL